jgi:hypothetical protein
MTTRRVLSIVTVLFLTIALLPLPAIAQGGGQGGGKGRGGSSLHRSVTLQHKDKVKDGGRTRDRFRKDGPEQGRVEASETPGAKFPPDSEKHRSLVPSRSVDPSATPKLRGIENALSMIQRNLVRMQAQLDAGKRTSLPAGLLAVAAKFMAWLGISPAPSPAPTSTPEPTATVEPTVTVPPTTP